MKIVSFRYGTRLLMVVMIIAAFALSACGGGSTTIPAKRDAGNDSNNGSDVGGGNSDTGLPDSGGDGDTGDNNGNNDDPCLQTSADDAAQFATDYAVALCQKMLSCDRNSSVAMMALFGGWVDQASCVDAVLADKMTAEQARAAVNSNTLKLDSCAATSCLGQIAALDCSDVDGPLVENYYPGISQCYEALVGSVSTGQPCTIDGQCGDMEFCQHDDESDVCGGKCEDVGLLLSGQCGDIVCRGDQFCTVENNVCVSRFADGAACEFDYQCSYDSTCANDVCEPIIAGLDAGADCDSMTALCKVGLMCLSEKCTVPGAQGEACQFAGCGAGLFCTEGGQCEERGDAGDGCADDSHCKSLQCVQGTCTDSEALCD